MDIFSFLKSLRSKVPKMIPLSKAAIHLSKYIRNDQDLDPYDGRYAIEEFYKCAPYDELYNVEAIYICTTEYHIGDQIRDECQRRKIKHECFPHVVERSTNKMKSVGYDYIYKIKINDTGLKTKQIADWAITTFNFKEMLLPADDIMAYVVWIHPSSYVLGEYGEFDEGGWRHDVIELEHWV